jgi:hypothetical protein
MPGTARINTDMKNRIDFMLFNFQSDRIPAIWGERGLKSGPVKDVMVLGEYLLG